MTASNLPLTQASVATHHSRSEKFGTSGDGKDIIAQVVVAAESVRIYDGRETLVLTGASQALQTIPGASTHATIYAEGATANDIARYWEDGGAPTSAVGKRLKDHEEIQSAQPSNFRAINSSGTITLRVSYYHYA